VVWTVVWKNEITGREPVLKTAMRLEIEPIADSLLNPTSARKLRVLREADQRDAKVVGLVLAGRREWRAAHQDDRNEQN
jgi:hypothetical protein